jgi:hypothetical protein
MVNGRKYDWEHITVQRKGITLIEIQNIDYGDKSGINRRRGKGRTTIGFTRKGIEGSGKMEITREEYNALLLDDEIRTKGFYNIDPVNIIIAYDKGDDETASDTLEDIVFTERKFSGIEVDTEGPMVELPFEILGGIITDAGFGDVRDYVD